MKYKLLTADNPTDLNIRVNSYLEKGWALWASPVMTSTYYGQAVIDISDEVAYMAPPPPLQDTGGISNKKH